MKTFTTEGNKIVAIEPGAGGVTRWTLASDQLEKHKLDPAWMADLKAAPKVTTDALALIEATAGVVVAPLV
jgi:hypothetical protein